MAVPPLGNTSVGPDVISCRAHDNWYAIVHLVARRVAGKFYSLWGCSGSGWARGMKPLILARGLPAVTLAETLLSDRTSPSVDNICLILLTMA